MRIYLWSIRTSQILSGIRPLINSYDTRHRTDVLSSTSASDSEGPQLPTLEVEAWFRGFQVRIMDDTVRLDSQRPSAAAAARLRRNADGGRAPVHRDRDRRRSD